MEKNYFQILNEINVSDKTELKNGLTYLSWAWAWAEIKKLHPTANYKIYEREDGRIYWDDGKTAWVKTGVIVNEIEHIEYLPVMNFSNKSIPVESITSTDVNKAIQRSLTKAVARHGLGLYVYAGEDLPEGEEKIKQKKDFDPVFDVDIAKVPTTAKEKLQKIIKDTCKSTNEKDIKNVLLIKERLQQFEKSSLEVSEEEARSILEELG